MNLAGFFAKMKDYQKQAEVIFDDEEPIGMATDVVMPRRRWVRRKSVTRKAPLLPPQQPQRS